MLQKRRDVVVIATCATLLVAALLTVGSSAASAHAAQARRGRVTPSIAAAESGLLPWQLAQPTSREVVVSDPLAGGGAGVLSVGGLTSGSASSARVAAITVPAGDQSTAGGLATPTHDAAGTVLGGRVLIFGGGDTTTVASVQSLPLQGPSAPPATATVVGQLPQPRSDAAAVTIGRTAYVVGGYDGAKADPAVLATTDGRQFRTVGTLRVPVRYAAVAAWKNDIYVFGGDRVGGAGGGAPVDTIQQIDTGTGRVTIVGHLPQAISGASAVTLGNALYIAGGTSGSGDTNAIEAFDPSTNRTLLAGHLIAPVANAAITDVGGTAWLVGGESSGVPTNDVQMLKPNIKFGTAGAPGAGSPYFGERLLIADRGNNRLLLLNDTGTITWTYPNPTAPPPPGPNGFYFPDDAFFLDHGKAIISNQEQNETIVKIAFPSGKILWTYGHPGQSGSAPGYLSEPDDAYQLKNGNITVADADNCRILVINPAGQVVKQIGTTGVCVHNPPTSLGLPNGDTPLPNGNFLISETRGSFISEYTGAGALVWTVHLAIGYPSDPQQLGPDLYLCADYRNPGGIIEFNRAGQILYEYRPTAGLGRLNQPSLVELLPSGVFMVNDDHRDRMVAIDPTTQALVWQYGVASQPGTAVGYLHTPDGFDILNANGTTPTHPQTG